MMHFRVNGKEMPLPGQPAELVHEFMEHVRREFNSETALISMIQVNGVELTREDEEALSNLSVSDIDSLEVFTAHPRELAEETLQSLLEFTEHLEKFSQQAADALEAGRAGNEFKKLVDGIATFTEAMVGAKQILRVGVMPSVNLLEVDLHSVLKDLLEFHHRGQREFVVELMREHLPRNLREWRLQGIPELIRSRDS